MTDISIKEVAKLAGVSIATVSRSINNPDQVAENTRNKVLEAIRETGYSPNSLAQSFRSGKTNLIMVVLPSVGNPFFSAVMRGIRNIAKTKGYSIVIEETEFDTISVDEFNGMLIAPRVDGAVLLASMSPLGIEALSSPTYRGPPIVFGSESTSPKFSQFQHVHVDNAAAAMDATEYLIANGHTKIGMLHGHETLKLTKGRELGYRIAMEEAGLNVDDGWVVDGKLTITGARKAMRALLEHSNRPTAIFCANDEMAYGCLHEIKATGLRVPADISVVGFDDVRYAEVTDPPLTTISQPAEEIGELAMLRLSQQIEQGPTVTSTAEIVPHRLVVRQSVARRTD